MTIRTFLSAGVLALPLLTPIAFAATEAMPISCPERGSPEKPEDCPWAGVARAIVAASDRQDPTQLAQLFRSLVPALFDQIRADSRRPDVKALWGRSINFDEGARGQIVHPSILRVLAQTIELPYTEQGNLVHAGMEHTYGYLFSTLKTSFGYKRARWVQGEIERGFGLTPGVLSPNTREGTLLLNITSFMGQIAFRTEQRELQVTQRASRDAAAELRRYDYGSLSASRLVERVEVPNENGKVRPVKIYTDLVPFPHKPANPKANSVLLIYSIVDPFSHGAQLISAFPVQEEFVRKVLGAGNASQVPITTRYNGFVDGLSGRTLPGERRVMHKKGSPWR